MTPETTVFAPGSMVRARGREWVVLPSDDEQVLLLRPLGGTDEDARGLYLPLEGHDVRPARLRLPDPERAGNAQAATLLRDAVRLGFRSAAGPLRSIARIAVEPRPYQLVPLLMALRLEPVRLLIGDDVGVGKTIEATLIARELLDRGEIRRICVLCPPHLCGQWRQELGEKFHISAVEVRPGTVTALERNLPLDRSIFQECPFTVVSIDFIKSDRRRAQFVQTCPELVIVDEAHTAADPSSERSAQHQRHTLVRELARDATRHVILATATPHSGNDHAFASLVGLLDAELGRQVEALGDVSDQRVRERLARHFVQRRRGDVDTYLKEATVFPKRETQERSYALTKGYQDLFTRTIDYTRELIRDTGLSAYRQRVRYWAALALLRCVGSSPAAAVAALETRAGQLDGRELDAARLDRLHQAAVFDTMTSDDADQDDSTPGADTSGDGDDGHGDASPDSAERRKLRALAREARALAGEHDTKLAEAERLVRELVDGGFHPIVFCRYVSTAGYVGEELRRRLRGVRVAVVTGELPAEERERRVAELGEESKRVLVATDCLSEGINLQRHFDAVVHYDLSWNPTRHEQREGRVDRYGQPKPLVRTALLYGRDNPVDGAVLQVLLRKADTIRKRLGVSVPVPVDTNDVLEAIMEALLLRPSRSPQQRSLFLDQEEERVDAAWEAAAAREQRTRTIFAQHQIKPEEVVRELEAARGASGSHDDVKAFFLEACLRLQTPIQNGGPVVQVDPQHLPRAVRSRAALDAVTGPLRLGFDLPVPDGVMYIPRTHPLIEALAGYVADTALEDLDEAPAKRCGGVRTRDVAIRTALLLLRLRFIVEERRDSGAFPMLAEECLLTAFRGDPAKPEWLDAGEAERLARVRPSGNVPPGQAQAWLRPMLAGVEALQPALRAMAGRRAKELLEAHGRVRSAARLRGVRYDVQPRHEIDLLGLYVLMPDGRPA